MEILVLYYSKGGNTRKLAEEVCKGIAAGGAEPVLKSTSEVSKEDFLAAKGIVAGSPVYFGVMAADLKRIFEEFVGLRRKMENKVGAAFATGGHHTGGKETTMISILQCMLIYGMIIVGDPMDASGHYGVGCVNGPDVSAAADAFKLGKRVAELCNRLHGQEQNQA